MKQCYSCKEFLPQSKFYFRKDNNTTYNKCKECTDSSYKEYYKSNKERILNQQQTEGAKQRKERELIRNYNITLNEWNDILSNQNDLCAICKIKFSDNSKTPHVDHCHKTGKIRGLLCSNCNHGIGQFKDDISILQEAIKYLSNFKC